MHTRLFRCAAAACLALPLVGCDDEPAPADVWPPTFQTFAFSSDLIVVYPGTCRTFDFTFDTRPPTRADDLEVTVDGGSMTVHTVEPLTERVQTEDRGEGHAVWRVCAGLEEPVEGSIRVGYREHPDYFVETRLVQREYLERIPEPGPVVTLPFAPTYPTDTRWSDDGSVLEIASRSGLVLHVDAATGVVLRSETLLPGGNVFLDDGHLLSLHPDRWQMRLVDRTERLHLSSVGLWVFSDGSGETGDIMYAHGANGIVATAGGLSPAPDSVAAFVSIYDLDAMQEDQVVYRFPAVYLPWHFPHVVVSPDGRRVAWSGLEVKSSSESIGWDWFEPSMDLSNNVVDLETGALCSFHGSALVRGENPAIIVSKPVFSSDSAWLAHWSSSDVPLTGQDFPLHVYDAATCTHRASTIDTPPNFHRGAVAVSAGGHVLAAVSEDEVHLYDVPEGVDQELSRRTVVPAIETPDLFEGTQSTGFSDRQLLRRNHYLYPGLTFSDDGGLLASVNTVGARIYDLDDDLRAVETPRIDPDDVEVFGPWVRVGVLDDEDGGDLVYTTGTDPGFVYRLSPDEAFVGIDQYGMLFTLADGIYHRRDLTTGAVEALGADPPDWQPALHGATVVITDTAVELHR